MNKEVIDSLIEKNPHLKNARSVLERMQPGSFCIHRAWGFGEIIEYDAADEKVVINFLNTQDKKAHRMAPAFCVDKLELLADDHILVRKTKDPEKILHQLKKAPTELVIDILNFAGGSISTLELERTIEYLFPDDNKGFRKWWNETRKLLVKEPRVGTPSKKTDPYVLRDEPVTPEEEILGDFYETKQSKKKIILAEKLLALSNDKVELKKDLPKVLQTLTEAIQETRLLTTADRLHGVWVRNDLARDVESDVETLQPTSTEILKEAENDLSGLVLELPASRFHRFLDLITRVYPDKWQGIILTLLRHSEGRFTGVCIQFLIEAKESEILSKSFKTWLKEQTMRGPILLWLLKNRENNRYADLVGPLMTTDLLKAVFYAIDNESLQNAGARRIPLADALIEDRSLIETLLSQTSAEIARDLAQTLMLSQGFEDLTKKSLMARFIKVHANIQALLDRSIGEATVDQSLVVSETSLAARKAEYERLVKEEIPRNLQAIETAREHGDLRENSEYKMAREDQNTLQARKAQLETDIARARVTSFENTSTETVSIGSVVTILDEKTKKTLTYAILGAWDSDPDRRILSYKTPLGTAVLNKRIGEKIEFEVDGNVQKYTLQAIGRWTEQAAKFA